MQAVFWIYCPKPRKKPHFPLPDIPSLILWTFQREVSPNRLEQHQLTVHFIAPIHKYNPGKISKEELPMARIVHFTQQMHRRIPGTSSVYAVSTVPAEVRAPTFQRHRLAGRIAWFLDIAISLGLGAVMVGFLVLLLISL